MLACCRQTWQRMLDTIDAVQKGQLGHGDLLQRNTPTIVEGLQGHNIVAGMLAAVTGHVRVLLKQCRLTGALVLCSRCRQAPHSGRRC